MRNPEIGFVGGMALLVSSITGPGLTTVPLLFQEAGWFLPSVLFLLVGILSASASLFLVEAMSHIRGNERFQQTIEFSTIAEKYLGRKSHIILQIILYLALQSVNISSIIISCQSMDTTLIQLFGKTCAVSFSQGWICETTVNSQSGSPFTTYILFSFGYLIAVVLVLPLSVLRLGQNIIVQLISATVLICIFIIWISVFFKHGLSNTVPVIGTDASQLTGFVVSNFAFVTTVPSFVNELNRNVSIHRVIWFPIIFCTLLYILLGSLGAASYYIESTSNILATINSSDEGRALTILSVIINILFPLSVLVTSIPIFAIVIRYNLIRGNICSKRWALVWAAFFPWILVIPFQTMGWLNIIVNWGSLLFGSSANFVIPFLLYFASKRSRNTVAVAPDAGDVLPLQHLSRHASSINTTREQHTPTSQISFSPSPHSAAPSVSRSSIQLVPAIQLVPPSSTTPRNSFSNNVTEQTEPEDSGKQDQYGFSLTTTPRSITEEPQNMSSDETSLGVLLVPPSRPSGVATPELLPYGHTRRRSWTNKSIDLELGVPTQSPISAKPDEDEEPKMDTDEDEDAQLDQEEPAVLQLTTGVVDRSHHSGSQPSISSGNNISMRSLRSGNGGDESSEDTSLTEVNERDLFHAFKETKWFRSIIFAQVGFVIMTLLVLGNLIYAIIETAEGNGGAG